MKRGNKTGNPGCLLGTQDQFFRGAMQQYHTVSNISEALVDGHDKDSWDRMIDGFADASIYQAWAYGSVRWGAKSLSHLVLQREGRPIAAAQLRIARLPILPGGIAYLRWGPMLRKTGEPFDIGVAQSMSQALRAEYSMRRGLTLVVMPNAFLADGCSGQFESALTTAGFQPAEIGDTYRTVLVDLRPSPEEIRKRLDQKWRNQLNRGQKNGLVVEVSQDGAAYRTFLELYDAMRARKQFHSSVDEREFAQVMELLPDSRKVQILVARLGTEPLGAIVCSLLGDTAIYLLGATSEHGRDLKAAYVLQWEAMMLYRTRGALHYDLGGIDPVTNPGGHHFKSGFGGREVEQMPAYAYTHGRLRGVVLSCALRLRALRRARAARK